MHERFEHRIDARLEKVLASCQNRKWKKEAIDRRVGQIMAKNSQAAGLYEVAVEEVDGRAVVSWRKNETWRQWAGLGDEPHRVFEELGTIRLVDVVLPTRDKNLGIRRRCVARPTEHQAILLDRLGLRLPRQLRAKPSM